jgi:predicted MPP superfamily phosphohydrolase
MLAALRIIAGLVVGLAPLAGLREPFSWALLAAVQLLGTYLAIRGLWIEPQLLTITRLRFRTPKLAPRSKPLRLLHLADIHMERLTRRDQEVIQRARALRPDVIVFTGDFLNLSYTQDRQAWQDAREMLKTFSAPLGVYAVSGSPPVDPPEVVSQLLKGLNIRWLRDERVTLTHGSQKLDLIGLTCTHVPEEDGPRLAGVLNGAGPGRLKILLYHSPDLAPEAAQLGIDLQLSGHTHGGQVRLPLYGALYAASIYGKRFEMGARQVGGMKLYVSRGIGMEGKGAPRVRFLCPPEITLFEIGHTG